MSPPTAARPPGWRRPAGGLLAAGGAAFIAAATLTPVRSAYPVLVPWYCLFCGDYAGIDFLLNVLLFVPLGAGLRMAGVSWRRVVLTSVVITMTVELLQLSVVPGRDASAADLVCNTLGGACGAALVARWRDLVLPGAGRSARLAWWGGAAWLALAVATAASGTAWSPGDVWLFRRAAWGQRFGWFPGRIVAVSNGRSTITVNEGDGDDRYAVPTFVPMGGPVRLEATVVGGGVAPALAAIATLSDRPVATTRTTAALGQRQRDLVFRVRTAAWVARVRIPGLTLRDVFAPRDERGVRGGWPVAGDTLRIAAEYVGRRLRLAVRWPGGGTVLATTVHPFVGWSYLLPWDYSYGPEADALSALWAGGLIAPVAYWAGRARRLRRASARDGGGASSGARRSAWSGHTPGVLLAAVVPALVGLVAVPAVAGVRTVPAVVWVGVGAAIALGIAAAAVVTARSAARDTDPSVPAGR